MVLTSCGSDVGEPVATRDRPDATRPLLRGCDSPDEAAASGFSTIYQFDSLDDWASHADVIARFEVVKESAGPLDEFEMEVPRYLDLRLTEVYSGPAQVGETFRMWDLIGWDQQPDGTLLQMTGPGCFRIEVGDDIIGALLGDGEDVRESGLLTPESALLIQNDVVVETLRTEPGLAELEGQPASAVEEMVRAAANR